MEIKKREKSVSEANRDKASAEAILEYVIFSGLEHSSPLIRRLSAENLILKHNYRYNAVVRRTCALEGCQRQFEITLVPRQLLYPKYCEQHRNAYKRALFLRQRARNTSAPHL